VPRLVPWIQAALVLLGFWFSLRNLKKSWIHDNLSSRQIFLVMLPTAVFITAISAAMIFFHTN